MIRPRGIKLVYVLACGASIGYMIATAVDIIGLILGVLLTVPMVSMGFFSTYGKLSSNERFLFKTALMTIFFNSIMFAYKLFISISFFLLCSPPVLDAKYEFASEYIGSLCAWNATTFVLCFIPTVMWFVFAGKILSIRKSLIMSDPKGQGDRRYFTMRIFGYTYVLFF